MVASTGAFLWLGKQWNALETQGWAAVLLVAIICSCLVLIALSLSYMAFLRLKTAAFTQHQTRPQDSVAITSNLELPTMRRIGARQSAELVHHKDIVIELRNLITSDVPVIENHLFENCEIVGPAVCLPKQMLFNGKTICRGIHSIEHALIEIEAGRIVAGVIEMRNCTFTDCGFRNVAIISDRPFIDRMREIFKQQ